MDKKMNGRHILVIGASETAEAYTAELQKSAERVIRLNEEIDWGNQGFANGIARTIMFSGSQLDAIVIERPGLQKQMSEGFNDQPLVKLASAIKSSGKPVIVLDTGEISESAKKFLSSIGVFYHNADAIKPEQLPSIVASAIGAMGRANGGKRHS